MNSVTAFALGAASMGLVAAGITFLKQERRQLLDRKKRRDVRLHLVGAGPGDPELLTLAAARVLSNADLIVADILIPQSILDKYVKKKTTIRIARKVKGKAHEAQEELQQWTLEGLEQGLDVVRLKGGDPFLYGRGGEEVQFFTMKGYKVEVIPGLSSSMVGPMAAGIPVTMRNHADQFVIATLHGKRDTTPGVPSPYRSNRTVVFLMSVARIEKLIQDLLVAGYPSCLPVTIIEKATMPEQRTLETSVATLSDDLKDFHLQSPAIIVVGGTAGNAARLPSVIGWQDGGVIYNNVI
jgi:uroporphyrin-III C-methyltransferase